MVHPQAEPPEEETVSHCEPQGKDKGEGSPAKGRVWGCGQVEQARYRSPNAENNVRQGAHYGSERENHYQGHDKDLHTIRKTIKLTLLEH